MTQTATKHTPERINLHVIPWEGKDGRAQMPLVAESGQLLGRLEYTTEEDIANAERLALCWNAHDELLAACEIAVHNVTKAFEIMDVRADWSSAEIILNNTRGDLEAAIAQARA